MRPEALANLPPRIARHHRPTITILFSPLSLLFFSFLRPRGMISAKEGGEGEEKKKENVRGKRGKRGMREGYEGQKESRIFILNATIPRR